MMPYCSNFDTRWPKLLALCIVMLCSMKPILGASNTFSIEQFRYQKSLLPYVHMLISDKTEAAEILEVSDEQWKPVFRDPRLFPNDSLVWLKSSVRNNLQVPIKAALTLKCSLYENLRIFVLEDGHLIEQGQASGNSSALPVWSLASSPSLIITIPAGSSRQILVSMQSEASREMSLEISDSESFWSESFYDLIRQSLLLSSLLILALACLLQGLMQRRSVPLALSAYMFLSLLVMVRLTHWPLIETASESLSRILPPLNHIVCGLWASLLVLLKRISHGLEPQTKIQRYYWLSLIFFTLYLAFVAALHLDQSLLIMMPGQILLVIILWTMNRLAQEQKHQRAHLCRLLLWQQLGLLALHSGILIGWIPLWYLPSWTEAITLAFAPWLVFLVVPSYRRVAQIVSTPDSTQEAARPSRQMESKSNLLHEQWLHAEKMAALGTFTNGLANELNNPLAIVAGHRFRLSSMIESRSFNIHEFEKSLGKIDHAVNRMIAVIDALKVYSQDPQAHEILKTFSLRETIKYTIDLCRDKVVSRGIKLSTPELGDGTIEGHQGQIIQVLLILVDNALDALDQSPEKSIRIELQPLPDTIRIAVIDSGPGVPLGLRGKIWDPFFTSKDPFRHKGLGLSIASGIVSNHRGLIFLDEATPETRFVVELPRTRRPLGLAQDFTTESR